MLSPRRIVCLTEEPTEILYLLGEGKRIVGISAYTCRPLRAKKEKPVVSAFTGGSVKKICALKPDLVIGFSDIQANLAKDLIAANQQVLIFNQRSVQEILDVISIMGRLVGREKRARLLVRGYEKNIAALQRRRKKRVPKVYFEEWMEPKICGIRWVSELVEIAGAKDIFRKKSFGKLAKERFVSDQEVVAAKPDIYIASWCGKPLIREQVISRPGWSAIPAISNNRIYEMDPSIILQPGPACLTDGLECLSKIISA